MAPSRPVSYEFDGFRFEPAEARLSRDGVPVMVEPKALAVLGNLVARPGHLLERDELLDAAWGHRHVTPSTLNRAVALLRQALADDANAPRFIETVPRRGYRFIATVREIAPGDPAHGDAAPAANLFRAPALPARIESTVVREGELAVLGGLLAQARLLTVLGPGGIGKTELALELARRHAPDFPGGVWLVDLSASRNATEAGEALLAAFGLVRQGPASVNDLLVGTLQARRALLVLDNCDRVAAACADHANALLRRCPGLSVLATSQVRLGVEGEQDYRVPPLTLPDPGWEQAADPVAAAGESEAVRLLALRAQEADPRFRLDAGNIAAVVGLCEHLEGLPLALELAASRMRVLGPHELLDRLQARREVLVADWQGPDRQRTVRDMLDWSFHLLSRDEARLLQCLALFSGGWTLEGAEALVREDGEQPAGRDVVGPLGSLVDKSFVTIEPGARPRRFRMLEAVREYVLEGVGSDGALDAFRLRHLRHYLDLTARADSALYRDPAHWFGHWIDREQANLRTAFEFALERGMADEALQLALNLRWYWWVIGAFQRSLEWIQRALAAHPSPSPRQRAQALQYIGMMQLHLGMPDAAAMLEEAVQSTTAEGLEREHGLALAALASLRSHGDDARQARRMLAQAIRVARRQRDVHVLAYALVWVCAMHATRGRHRLAFIAARRASGELDAFAHARGQPPGLLAGLVQANIGLQALYLGDLGGAARAFDAVMRLAGTLRNLRMAAASMEGFGYLLHWRGQHALSARLLGQAQALRELTGVPMSPHWQQAHREVWRSMRQHLGAEADTLFESGLRERQEDLQAALHAQYPAMGLDPRTVRPLVAAA